MIAGIVLTVALAGLCYVAHGLLAFIWTCARVRALEEEEVEIETRIDIAMDTEPDNIPLLNRLHGRMQRVHEKLDELRVR